ncbi:cytochrome c biogenesis CcdA family protein [Rhodoplanes azumiensis]|uniref:Cytochrome c biogenesis CcdA family protein n=1 Tax=Rhodoplanes azumiensis TaxID=1897628 RepID=A0ABW5AHX3_9BRAD
MNGAAAILTAFVAGIVSSATPCVVAAVPVTIGFVGSRSSSRRQAILLSGAFVGGMTLAFVALGLAAARLGVFFGASGGPWAIMVGLLLAAAGVWFWRSGDTCSVGLHPAVADRLRGSGWLGAAAFGALTGTVMTPCATPALAAALSLAGTGAFLGQATWTGAAMLLAYGLGHGVLLFVAGVAPTYVQTLVGRVGRFERWLPGRRTFAGVLVLAGLWMISSAIPGLFEIQ